MKEISGVLKIAVDLQPIVGKRSQKFSYTLFMSWINETSETSRNHYRASHRRESIKTKQEKELLKIISGYILFATSFYSLYLLLLLFLLNMADTESETHSGDLPVLQPLPPTHFVNEKNVL